MIILLMTLGTYWFVQGDKNVIVFNGMFFKKKKWTVCAIYLMTGKIKPRLVSSWIYTK